MHAAKYAATEGLRNGATLQIRALLPGDRAEMLAAVGRFSEQTLYRRFFAPKRSFSEREIDSSSMWTSSATWRWWPC